MWKGSWFQNVGAWKKKERSPMVVVLVRGIDRVLLSVEERSCLVGM